MALICIAKCQVTIPDVLMISVSSVFDSFDVFGVEKDCTRTGILNGGLTLYSLGIMCTERLIYLLWGCFNQHPFTRLLMYDRLNFDLLRHCCWTAWNGGFRTQFLISLWLTWFWLIAWFFSFFFQGRFVRQSVNVWLICTTLIYYVIVEETWTFFCSEFVWMEI